MHFLLISENEFFHEIKHNRMTSFMNFMWRCCSCWWCCFKYLCCRGQEWSSLSDVLSVNCLHCEAPHVDCVTYLLIVLLLFVFGNTLNVCGGLVKDPAHGENIIWYVVRTTCAWIYLFRWEELALECRTIFYIYTPNGFQVRRKTTWHKTNQVIWQTWICWKYGLA